ncbi:mechanosensitive ion channel [Fulvivirga ulvae]|uniref:mechanosensitive ion channel family protein n=1 Tax=Fulvivirga ulvae TaxID=2904245 RepID=UPI001F1A7CF9|nr:mechanosensitive ion channel [Fulvivirga ulvae]UII32079.1 mechanosensitive ion channel [Fulvivirga ulvae]
MKISLEQPLEKVSDKINDWLETLVAMLPNMALAIILLIVFFLFAKAIQKVFVRLFDKTSDNKALQNLFGTIIYYLVLGVGIFIILGVLKLDKTVTSLLAGVGVIGLALGFAFQDVASNFVCGIILAFRRPSKVGDIVKVKDFMGTVVRTNLRVTVIKTFQGQEVYIPNKEVLQSPIINYTVLGERRIDIPVGISYGDDLEKVESVVSATIAKLEGVIRKEDIIFDYYEFGDSSINFNIRFWIRYPDQPGYLNMKNAAIMAIKKAFDANDITIPFPIRTLDFGIKGGEKLSEMKLMTAES